MSDAKQLRKIVKQKYGQIAKKSTQLSNCGCGCGCDDSGKSDYSVFNDSYENLSGYVAEADLALGCGIPTQYAQIKPGHTVVDLGSGAGNDAFVARSLVGETGRVIGIDMTPEMISKANQNLIKIGYTNIEFRLGDIENMPVEDNLVDVVISNCVLNLVPDKLQAFSEIYRILKPGAHFCISDVVIRGQLPPNLQKSAEMYTGCVAGALQINDYLNIIRTAGFTDVEIKTSKSIELPDKILQDYLSREEIREFRNSDVGIYSITVTAKK